MTAMPITPAFTIIGRGNWTGGETYLRNMLGTISREMPDKVCPKLFVSPQQAEKIGSSLDAFLSCPPIVNEIFAGAGRGRSLLKALTIGHDSAVEKVLREHGADIVFESAIFYGRQFGLPAVSWIPDFQHRHLSHLFTRAQWHRRDFGFKMQIASNRTIMLSSENARQDCEQFYPNSIGKTAVVPFAIDFEPARHVRRHAEMTAKYNLPARFAYLPNQFWQHKNHALVVKALEALKAEGVLDRTLPIVLTGRTDDPRNPKNFDGLMLRVRQAGLSQHFRYLGLIPYDDVFGLSGSCDVLINPSLFEGWSTTVEEAKGLGCRLLLSDIAIHREQAPDATFFGPNDVAQLARRLIEVAQSPAHVRLPAEALVEAQLARRRAYAANLLATFRATIARGAPACR
jgi:glycosyltransferase involved in cell wall biosynthesis